MSKGFKISRGLLSDLNWRIRDELHYRHELGRTGGHFHVSDAACQMSTEFLKILDELLGDFRRDAYGNADT